MAEYGSELLMAHQVAAKRGGKTSFYCQLPILCNWPRNSSASSLSDYSLSP